MARGDVPWLAFAAWMNDNPRQATVEGAVTPYLAIELERSGQPPNLLAGVGSAVLFDDQGEPAAGPTSLVPTFLAARYSRDALGLVLPLAASHRYTVESAAVSLVGATGTWDAGNNWTVALSSRSASLGVDTVLATGTFSPATSAGAGTVNLSPQAAVDGDATPARGAATNDSLPPRRGTGSAR